MILQVVIRSGEAKPKIFFALSWTLRGGGMGGREKISRKFFDFCTRESASVSEAHFNPRQDSIQSTFEFWRRGWESRQPPRVDFDFADSITTSLSNHSTRMNQFIRSLLVFTSFKLRRGWDSATSFISSSLDELAARPSRFRLLAKHRCGLRIPHESASGTFSSPPNKNGAHGAHF